MSIRLLPQQVANQISAGEVVERPASVVKELLENSLDSGATAINIEIERGGVKMIRIRDNGCGIVKEELSLALARHSTNKIICLDDLECIISMGFRGEALASISSVARLTLTSRPAVQNEGWQIYREKPNMVVILNPVAHPVGTTVEVMDLFYNTPARRKFMRTEKTEFSYIDEVIRRIALAWFEVTFIVHHNGKMVRQYRSVNKKSEYFRRLIGLCGSKFVEQSLEVSWRNGDLAIRGWVADPACGVFPEMRYTYVNQRMIRDKLINHAVRQAYQDQVIRMQKPVFVLFIEVNPHQVDVNVHPTKHEVRFQQARVVHDFVYNAVTSVLKKNFLSCLGKGKNVSVVADVLSKNLPVSEKNDCFQSVDIECTREVLRSSNSFNDKKNSAVMLAQKACESSLSMISGSAVPVCGFGQILTIYPPCYALLKSVEGLTLLSLLVAERYLTERRLILEHESLRSQPLLIPLRMTLSFRETEALKRYERILRNMGIMLHTHQCQAVLNAVPLSLRQENLQNLISELLGYLYGKNSVGYQDIAAWLAQYLHRKSTYWSYSRAIALLSEVEKVCSHWLNNPPDRLLVTFNLEAAIKTIEV